MIRLALTLLCATIGLASMFVGLVDAAWVKEGFDPLASDGNATRFPVERILRIQGRALAIGTA